MAFTKRDLQAEVDRLNDTYCKRSKNEFKVVPAYGGYQVVLTGKKSERAKKNKQSADRGLKTKQIEVTSGYLPAREALMKLEREENSGWLKKLVRIRNKD